MPFAAVPTPLAENESDRLCLPNAYRVAGAQAERGGTPFIIIIWKRHGVFSDKVCTTHNYDEDIETVKLVKSSE